MTDRGRQGESVPATERRDRLAQALPPGIERRVDLDRVEDDIEVAVRDEQAALAFRDLTPPYSTLVVDPPWSYRTTKGITARVGFHSTCADDTYSTMTNGEIAALPVGHLAAENAHLYLWTTNPKMFGDRKRSEIGPVEIMEAWGFRYVTLLTWVKTGALGMGFYYRGDTEHVLFGVKGDLGVPAAKRERNVFTAAKGRHSAKPAAFMDMVERVSPGPYVELFARAPRLGWDSWGKGYEIGATA